MSITFTKVSDAKPVVDHLAATLTGHLRAKQRVLWLVAGGSAIAVAVEVAKRLQGVPLEGLAVTLTDERYDVVGHKDSNWQQLMDAGFVLPGAHLVPVLNGATPQATAAKFDDLLHTALGNATYRLGLFGIGPDGHTSGILPHSPAADATGYAIDYESDPYRRVTSTAPAIARLDEAVVYAMGEAKRPVLAALLEDQPLADHPAQALKAVPRLTIYSDTLGS